MNTERGLLNLDRGGLVSDVLDFFTIRQLAKGGAFAQPTVTNQPETTPDESRVPRPTNAVSQGFPVTPLTVGFVLAGVVGVGLIVWAVAR